MESSDLVLSPTPSAERLAWLTQWARDKGATHAAFDFTCDVTSSDALFILLAMAVDPESPSNLRAGALARVSRQLRFRFDELPASNVLLHDLRLLLPKVLSLEEMHGFLHVAYSLHNIRVLYREPLDPTKPNFELTEQGKTVAAGHPLEFATDLLGQANAYLERLPQSDFEAMSLQTRRQAGELLLTHYLHGSSKAPSWPNKKRWQQIVTKGWRVWAHLKPHGFVATGDGAACSNTLSGSSLQIVCERLRGESEEQGQKVACRADSEPALASSRDTATALGEMLVVIAGAIPPAKDAEDNATIKRFSELQGPLGVVLLPELSMLMVIKDRLCGEFPWAVGAIEEIFSGLLLKRRCGVLRCQLPPTLIAGRPGVGKTRFARRLAEELSLPFRAIGVGGMNDSFALLGTSRGWSTGHPSPLLDLLAKSRSPSALVLLDEVEKASDRVANSTSVTSALLGLLEPQSARRWYDTFLQTECDLSAMSFILTANALQSLPTPFLSRCQLVMFDEPRREHIEAVVPHALADLARDWGLPGDVFVGYESIARSLPVRSMRELKAALTYRLKSELITGPARWLH
jgi:ATP-dependent Lon protease